MCYNTIKPGDFTRITHGTGGKTPGKARAMETIRIKLSGYEFHEEDHTPAKVAMWYDRHFRHWVIYPVDAEGNQTCEAVYGFGKTEAAQIKRELEAEYDIK